MSGSSQPAARPLAPRPRVLLAVAAAALAMLVAMGVQYAGEARADAIDRAADDWWRARFRGRDRAAEFFADFGNALPVLAASLVLFGVALMLGARRVAGLAVLAPVVATLMTTAVLKPAFHRTHYLADRSGRAYPSGHATAVCTVLLVLVMLVFFLSRRRAVRAVAVVGCGLIATLVAGGLVAAGYHYTTDTVGAALWAVTVVLALSVVIDQVALRLKRRSASWPAT